MANTPDPIRAAVARCETARVAVTRADAESDRIGSVLATLRTDLERLEHLAASVADDAGRALVAELLDGAKPARSTTTSSSLLSAGADVQKQQAAVAAAEQRHAAAATAAASARAELIAAIDTLHEAEVRVAADALLDVWPRYRDAWARYHAAMDAAGHYTSPISERVFGTDVEVQPVGQVSKADLEAAAATLMGWRLRVGIQ